MSALQFTEKDGLFDYLINDVGLSSATVEDCLVEYFLSLLYTGSLGDMEDAFLIDAGHTTGSLGDKWYAYLGAKGYAGSLWDRFSLSITAGDLFA
jgi:hypothetical protein